MKNWLCMISTLSETHTVKPPNKGQGHLSFVERLSPEFSIGKSLKTKEKTL